MSRSPVVAALGLPEDALDEALAWARGRTAELLRSVSDRELLALLDPPGTRATLELRAIIEPEDEQLYDEVELDEVELPELEWEPDAAGVTPDDEPRTERMVRPSPVPPSSPEPLADGEAGPPSPLEEPSPAVQPDVRPEATEPSDTEPPAPPVKPVEDERRRQPRYSLADPAVIEIGSWSELVTLYVKDISCGGMFVETTAPPARDTEVTVQLLLPEGTGTLGFDGLVVHVVTVREASASGRTPGFGLQFRGLTPERRRALQRLVEQAERAADSPSAERPRLSDLGFSGKPGPAGGLRLTLNEAERAQMQQLRTELAAMSERGDLEVLGLSDHGGFDELRAAFERLARRWHPGVAHRDAPPEIRALATEIFLRIERAYRRLCDEPRPAPPPPAEPPPPAVPPPPAFSTDGPRPETVIGPAPTAPPSSPSSRSRRATPMYSSPTPDTARVRQRAKRARRMVGDLVDRGEKLTRQLKRRRDGPPDRNQRRTRVDAALKMISDKRYVEAAQQLEALLVERPEPRLRVLLSVVNARRAIKDRDFARARSCYQAVLQMDPNNALAQRELLMLSAMEDRR